MILQKQLSKKRGKNIYYKHVLVVPNEIIEQSGFKEGDELEAVDIRKGEMRIKKK